MLSWSLWLRAWGWPEPPLCRTVLWPPLLTSNAKVVGRVPQVLCALPGIILRSPSGVGLVRVLDSWVSPSRFSSRKDVKGNGSQFDPCSSRSW